MKRSITVLTALVLALAACGSSGGTSTDTLPATSGAAASTTEGSAATDPPPETEPEVDLSGVTITFADVSGARQAVLGAAGELDDVPYKLEWIDGKTGADTLRNIQIGAADIMNSGESTILTAVSGGLDVKVVAAHQQTPDYIQVLVRPDSPLTTIEDLKGKKVAVNRGSTAQVVLIAALEKAGLQYEDVEIVYLNPPEGRVAFVQGQVDAWATFDPNVAFAEVEDGARAIIPGSSVQDSTLALFAVSSSALADEGKAAAIGDLLVRFQRAYAWIYQNPDAYAAYWSEVSGLPVEVAAHVVRRGESRTVALSDDLVPYLEWIVERFTTLDIVPTEVDVPALLDNRYADLLGG